MNPFLRAVRWFQTFSEGTHEVQSLGAFYEEIRRSSPVEIVVMPRPARSSWLWPNLHRSVSMYLEAVYPGSHRVRYRVTTSRLRPFVSVDHDSEGAEGDFMQFVFDQMDEVRALAETLPDTWVWYFWRGQYYTPGEFEAFWGKLMHQRIERVGAFV